MRANKIIKQVNGYDVYQASPLPLGTVVESSGVRFSLFSRRASKIVICIFEKADDLEPAAQIQLEPDKFRFGDIWSVFIAGLQPGSFYAWVVEGEKFDPERDGKYILDPYAKAVAGVFDFTNLGEKEKLPEAPKSVVVKSIAPRAHLSDLQISDGERIIYEVHLKGFTAHPSSQVKSPGTYKGFIEKIDHLKELGVTTVELLPIQAFPENENVNINPETGERLKNYWGYSTMSFMSPHNLYARGEKPGCEVEEFRELVDKLHEAGMEVILDIVFNHTAEGSETGPVLSFKSIDEDIYYIRDPKTGKHRNYSGCGNTFNCNHPIVRDYILDVLHFWVIEMGVDGFRFDLASILGRDQEGNLMDNPPLVERITNDPILRKVKLIAEAWDASGAYQVGSFPGTSWAEWNGRYRDEVRRFWLQDGNISQLATRISGSEDLYGPSNRSPRHSVNFITCHDGFTLRDLVSYNQKHNYQNGENNRDGENNNCSNNHGFEGSVTNLTIRTLRLVQMKNLLATLFLSQGVPMLFAGDEAGKTKTGNNNTYCQDNPLSWLDWRIVHGNSQPEFQVRGYADPEKKDIEEGKELLSFVKKIIAFRQGCDLLKRCSFFKGEKEEGALFPDISWQNEIPGKINWNTDKKILGVLLWRQDNSGGLMLLFNGGFEQTEFFLPEIGEKNYSLVFDTSSPQVSFQDKPAREKTQTTFILQGPAVAALEIS
ncbi:MAG: glycogen debranching protein [Myxococcota bacterium]